jgi:hypothetical protein
MCAESQVGAHIKAEVIGSWIVVTADGNEIARLDGLAPVLDGPLDKTLRERLEATLFATHQRKKPTPLWASDGSAVCALFLSRTADRANADPL